MNPIDIVLKAVPIILAITAHEVAHGWTAKQLGDDTADRLGRLSLNPLRHIDPIGTILIPGILMLLPGGFLFGWAKPVPVDWRNLRNPRRDMALVAAAGPGANLLMILLWAMALRAGVLLGPGALSYALISMGEVGIIINTVLMVLNLFPVPPLDGSRVVTSILPVRYAVQYNRIEPFGLIVVALLLMTGVLGAVVGPALFAIDSLVKNFALGRL
jgi:Zn-dependent protease